MNAGSHIEAFIGNSPCKIVETRSDKAICVTGPSERLDKAEVRMVFDKGTRVLNGRKYEFVDDPHIDYVYSENSGVRKIPTTIPSGGVNITVVGGNFNYIQDPEMYVVYQVCISSFFKNYVDLLFLKVS